MTRVVLIIGSEVFPDLTEIREFLGPLVEVVSELDLDLDTARELVNVEARGRIELTAYPGPPKPPPMRIAQEPWFPRNKRRKKDHTSARRHVGLR